jgi:hypothetical protein
MARGSHKRLAFSMPVFRITTIIFPVHLNTVSKLGDSDRHEMINVERYSTVSDSFVANEALIRARGTFQRRLRYKRTHDYQDG